MTDPPNRLTTAQDNFWYAYRNATHVDDLPPADYEKLARALANSAFRAGARWATHEESLLSPYIARFIEMMILLGYLDDNSPLFAANPTYHEPPAGVPQTEAGG